MEKNSCLISLLFSSARVHFLPVITIFSLGFVSEQALETSKKRTTQSHNGVMTVMAAAHATLFTRCCF